MRVGLVRNVGLSITALAVLGLGACNDNPVNFDVKNTVGIDANPTDMVVPAGRTALLESRAVNQGGEPTYDAVSAAIDATCGPAAITVDPDPDALEIQPPGRFIVTGGGTLGQTCITLASGSNTTSVEVTVVTDAIEITAPDQGTVYRAGETGQVVAQLIDNAGGVVGPYAPEDATFSSSDSDVAAFTDDMGNFSTTVSGTATLQVTWAGQAANGTAGIGVVRSDDVGIEVIANVPASVALDNGDDFGAIAGGTEATAEAVVFDALGNQNTDETEITACTAVSDDVAVATAACELVLGNSVNVIVTVTAVAPGSANISGTVTTSTGVYDYGPAPVVVLAPSVTGSSAADGFVGTALSITGTGLAAAGFTTELLVDGAAEDAIFIVSATDTQVDVLMPDLGNANDSFELGIAVGGVAAPETVAYTQLADARPDEPLNDSPGTPTPIVFPLDAVGSFEGADVDDFHIWTSAVDETITIDLDWNTGDDLDILVTDAAFTAFVCTDGATGAQPEQSLCSVTAGDYLLWINNFSGADHPNSYRVMATQ